MDTLFFTLQGKKYSGHIISNTDGHDQYYWFVFDDDELIEQFGDSIAFHIRNGLLKPVYTYSRFVELIAQLQAFVEEYRMKLTTQ